MGWKISSNGSPSLGLAAVGRLDQRQREPLAHHRQVAAPVERERRLGHGSTFAWIRAGSPSVPGAVRTGDQDHQRLAHRYAP